MSKLDVKKHLGEFQQERLGFKEIATLVTAFLVLVISILFGIL